MQFDVRLLRALTATMSRDETQQVARAADKCPLIHAALPCSYIPVAIEIQTQCCSQSTSAEP